MHFAAPSSPQRPADPVRTLSVGLVVALHLAFAWALVQGLMPRMPWQAPPAPIAAQVSQPDRLPPPELPLDRVDPMLQRPVIEVYVPPLPTSAEPSAAAISATTTQPPEGPVTTVARQPDAVVGATQGERTTPLRQSASMLCPVMAPPEAPASGWDGVAQFTVQGTVQGGRVVAVEVLSRAGAMDRRALRALTGAIDTALRSYRCNNDGVFVQEFVFRPE